MDRLDALERHFGFREPSSVPFHRRRPPLAVTAAGVLSFFELESSFQLAPHDRSEIVPLLTTLAIIVGLMTLVIVLYTPRRGALCILVVLQVGVATLVIYRSVVDHRSPLIVLLWVLVATALLLVPSSSRRFYRGE